MPLVPRLGRRIAATVATAALGSLVLSLTVTSSTASWTDREWDTGGLLALNCAAPGAVDARAWGRVLAGQLQGASLDPIAATDGITVTNLAPATSSTGASLAAPVSSLGSDAWSAALGLSALSSLNLGAGLLLPLDAGTGVYTQYGRAASTGQQVGASGAVTTQSGGLASLDPPTSSTPRLGTLRLSSVLDSLVAGSGTPVGRLSDVALQIGAVGSIAAFDGCGALWSPATTSSRLSREYLVSGLGLGFTSDLVSGFGTSLQGTLTTLQSTLNTTLNAAVSASVVSAVAAKLTSALTGIAGIGLGNDPVQVTVAGTVNLAPVTALLGSDISDGVVTLNLASGRVTADLAALLGQSYADSNGLNGRAANTSVLTPGVINALLTRISTLLTNFVTNTIQPAIAKVILDTAITIRVVAHLDATVTVLTLGLITVPNIIEVDSLFSGTIGGFTGASGYAAPTVGTQVNLLPGGGLATAALNTLLGVVTGPIVSGIATTLLPAIGGIVVAPLLTSLSAIVTSTLAGVTGTTIPALITALAPVLNLLAQLVKLTLNAQPDQPGSVGPPVASVAGRYFVSALQVGVVNGGTSVLALWAASSSVGPQARR